MRATLKDLSDNGTDGEVRGRTQFVDGKIGKAVELDGKDNVVKINKKTLPLRRSALFIGLTLRGKIPSSVFFFNNNGWKAGDIHYQLPPIRKSNFQLTAIQVETIRSPIS